jgi:tetratricopeptide (TPR) repeat protein
MDDTMLVYAMNEVRPSMDQQALCSRAAAFHRAGDLTSAERLYREAAEATAFMPRYLLGVVCFQQGRYEEALKWIDDALAINTSASEALNISGLALQALERHEEALMRFAAALAAEPTYIEAWNNHGVALQHLGRHEEALVSYDKALAGAPDNGDIWNNRGVTLQQLGLPEEALASFDRSLAANPRIARAWNNRGLALHDVGRVEESLASFDHAITIDPNHLDAHWNKGLAALQLGRFDDGWPLYEWRLKRTDIARPRSHDKPLWSGQEGIVGKALLVCSEQGFGDTIQFCRYAKLAVAKGARVILSVHDALVPLISSLEPEIAVVGESTTPPPFDRHIPLLSLPLAFGTTNQNIPTQIPYLAPDPARVEHWKAQIGSTGFRVGVAWQGGSRGRAAVGRAFPLAALAGVAAIPGVRLISLQKKDGLDQLGDLPPQMAVETLGDQFDAGDHAFLDAAAAMDSLDLVITSDSAIAHLGGALGRRIWVGLQFIPDWRWQLDRSDSPWYPTMRLFRQHARGDWPSVFAEMEEVLRAQLAPLNSASLSARLTPSRRL